MLFFILSKYISIFSGFTEIYAPFTGTVAEKFFNILVLASAGTGLAWVCDKRLVKFLSFAIRDMETVFIDIGRIGHIVVGFLLVYITSVLFFSVLYFMLYDFGVLKFCQITGEETNFFDFIYFSIVTASTVGYGNLSPCGQLFRLIAILQMLVTMIIVLPVFGVVVNRFIGSQNAE